MILNTFYNSIGKMSVQTKCQCIHGINPRLSYKNSSKFFDLPRFSSQEMKEARSMNKIALNDIRVFYDKSFKNAEPKDFLRLKDNSSEASFARVRWVNPKDNKAYFLLKNGEPVNGIQSIRILDSTGKFLKNAEIKKKKIIIFELENDKKFENINNLTHSDLTSIFAKRFNPFADIKVCLWKEKFDIGKNLLNLIDDSVSAISCAFSADVAVNKLSICQKLYNRIFHKSSKVNPKKLSNELESLLCSDERKLGDIPSHIRIFMASGNDGKNAYNKYLALNRVEGVGSLSDKKKISDFSGSRNSYFTQHYEKGEFPIIQFPEGFMFTGTGDIDIPCKTDKFKLIKDLDGTSFAVSIRAAKVVLNQMMEGIL